MLIIKFVENVFFLPFLNTRYEFPENLYLSQFLPKQEESGFTYTLHTVLVHSNYTGNHYEVFINPKGDGKVRKSCIFES